MRAITTSCITGILFMLALPGALCARTDPYDTMAREITDSVGSFSQNAKIAILPFNYLDKRVSDGGAIVSERLTTRVVKLRRFQVIERQLLQNVLSELHLESTGVVDADTAKQLGKVLGVEAILTGTLMDVSAGRSELNARLIRTETAEVVTTSVVEVDKIWSDVSASAAAAASQYPSPQSSDQPAAYSQPVVYSQPAPAARTRAQVHGFVDFFTGASGGGKVDLVFKNSTARTTENELNLDLNGNGILDSFTAYRSVAIKGAETNNSPPLGLRFVGFGKNWGGAMEISAYSQTIKKQQTAYSLNDGPSGTFRFFVDDYFKVTVINILSGDVLFRFSDGMFQPYVGMGIGLSITQLSSPYVYGFEGTVWKRGFSEIMPGFTFRVPLGLRVVVAENTALFVEFRQCSNYTGFSRTIKNETDTAYATASFILLGAGAKF